MTICKPSRTRGQSLASLSVTVRVTEEIARAKRDQKILSAFDAVASLRKDEEFKNMFDWSFDHPRGFFALSSKPTLKSLGDRFARNSLKTDAVVSYTHFCLQVSAFGKYRAVKETASKLYDCAAAKQDSRLFKDVEPLLTERRQKLSFLYNASRSDTPVLEFPIDRHAMWRLLTTQSEKPARRVGMALELISKAHGGGVAAGVPAQDLYQLAHLRVARVHAGVPALLRADDSRSRRRVFNRKRGLFQIGGADRQSAAAHV